MHGVHGYERGSIGAERVKSAKHVIVVNDKSAIGVCGCWDIWGDLAPNTRTDVAVDMPRSNNMMMTRRMHKILLRRRCLCL